MTAARHTLERVGPAITPDSLRRFALSARRKLRNEDGTYRRDYFCGRSPHADAARAGLNFLDPEIHLFVREQLLMREEGAAYDEDRLFGNALSSMPLGFNLFVPLAMDLELTSSVFRKLLPDFVHYALAMKEGPLRYLIVPPIFIVSNFVVWLGKQERNHSVPYFSLSATSFFFPIPQPTQQRRPEFSSCFIAILALPQPQSGTDLGGESSRGRRGSGKSASLSASS